MQTHDVLLQSSHTFGFVPDLCFAMTNDDFLLAGHQEMIGLQSFVHRLLANETTRLGLAASVH
jgi:hypothetical protein